MDIRSLVISELSLFSWREGERISPGSDAGKLAIAWVIHNRVKAGWQDGSWLKVIENIPVHSASDPVDIPSLKMPDPWSPPWRRLSDKCTGIYDGTLKDDISRTPDKVALAANLPGSDKALVNQSRPSFFWANLNMPIRPWFMEKVIQSPDHPRIADIPPIVLFA